MWKNGTEIKLGKCTRDTVDVGEWTRDTVDVGNRNRNRCGEMEQR